MRQRNVVGSVVLPLAHMGTTKDKKRSFVAHMWTTGPHGEHLPTCSRFRTLAALRSVTVAYGQLRFARANQPNHASPRQKIPTSNHPNPTHREATKPESQHQPKT